MKLWVLILLTPLAFVLSCNRRTPAPPGAESYSPEQTPKRQMGENPPQQPGTVSVGPMLQQNVNPADAKLELHLTTNPDFPGFDPGELTVKQGEVVMLTFTNRSSPKLNYEHSFVLVRPGTQAQVALELERNPREATQGLTRSGNVLAETMLLKPGKSQTIYFRAPSKPGDYPFICGFPGHANIEKGVLHVSRAAGSR